jgi:hypothetical protein
LGGFYRVSSTNHDKNPLSGFKMLNWLSDNPGFVATIMDMFVKISYKNLEILTNNQTKLKGYYDYSFQDNAAYPINYPHHCNYWDLWRDEAQ